MAERYVAMLHGWGGSFAATFRAAGWDTALAARGFSVVGIDLPGHGPSGGSHEPADYADMAGQVAEKIPQTVDACIAFSLGAKLALELEARNPGRFSHMVLGGIGDNIFSPEPGGPALCAVLRNETPLSGAPPQIQALVRYTQMSGSDPLCLAAVLERPANPRHEPERLRACKASILLINGGNDTIAGASDRLIAAVPRLRHVTIADCDHIGLTGNPAFMKAAIDFLSASKEAG